uniref:Anaphase-promoting complex subunit 5 N-terminal domain-containing protein n=1 Tax=Salmo trutta TaxID=8032 RepID=A0A674D3K4_SALTR
MSSVHERLYFNPMMTNGVVHANVFGIKDWVTLNNISVLAYCTRCPRQKQLLFGKEGTGRILPSNSIYLKDMDCFFATLPTPFSAIDSEAFKTNVVGLFMRYMLLAYIKLPFKQVYKLYKALQHYYHSHYAQPGDGQMDLTSTEDTVGERMEEEELDTAPLHELLKVEVVVAGSILCNFLRYAALNLAALHCRFGHQ